MPTYTDLNSHTHKEYGEINVGELECIEFLKNSVLVKLLPCSRQTWMDLESPYESKHSHSISFLLKKKL